MLVLDLINGVNKKIIVCLLYLKFLISYVESSENCAVKFRIPINSSQVGQVMGTSGVPR